MRAYPLVYTDKRDFQVLLFVVLILKTELFRVLSFSFEELKSTGEKTNVYENSIRATAVKTVLTFPLIVGEPKEFLGY